MGSGEGAGGDGREGAGLAAGHYVRGMDGSRPTGTVTFLFTDLESSTRQWEDDPDVMAAAVARHEVLLRDAIERHGGYLFGHRGDGVGAAFPAAQDGVAAAVDGQRAIRADAWPDPVALVCRMGIPAPRQWGRPRCSTASSPDSSPCRGRR